MPGAGCQGEAVNVRKALYLILIIFAFLGGLALGALGAGFGGSGGRKELRERIEQVTRDLNAALESQREAAVRASKLQTELQGITDHARSLEEGTRRAEARAGSLAQQLDGIIDQSGELSDGINRASDSLEESRILLDELGTLLRSLPGVNRKEN